MSINEYFTRANITPILAVIIILGGFSILAFNHPTTDIKIGVFALMGTVANFYFGSSRGSQLKDQK